MEKMDKNSIWASAAKWGLIFGVICIAYDGINRGLVALVDPTSYLSVAISLLQFVLWAAKFVGLIILMNRILRAFYFSHEERGKGQVILHGLLISVLSGLVYAAFGLMMNLYIFPDVLAESAEALRTAYAQMGLDAHWEEVASLITDPSTIFFGELLYCSLYGLILSAILSAFIHPKDIFADNN